MKNLKKLLLLGFVVFAIGLSGCNTGTNNYQMRSKKSRIKPWKVLTTMALWSQQVFGINDLIGTIYAYPTSNIPEGFLECNGSEYKSNDYPELYSALNGTYGERSSNGIIYFTVPDYRGYFLRGWDHGAEVDPVSEVAWRGDRGDGTTGNNIGTIQIDAFQGHWHALYSFAESVCGGGGAGQWESEGNINNHFIASNAVKEALTDGVRGIPRVASETRPKNINVMYIIYAKEINKQNYTNQTDFLALQQKVDSIDYANQSDFLSLQDKVDNINYTNLSDFLSLENKVSGINYTDLSDFEQLQDQVKILQGQLNDTLLTIQLLNNTSSSSFNQGSEPKNNDFIYGLIAGLSGGISIMFCIGSICLFKKYKEQNIPKSGGQVENPVQLSIVKPSNNNFESQKLHGENEQKIDDSEDRMTLEMLNMKQLESEK